jgi:hypothetical protein
MMDILAGLDRFVRVTKLDAFTRYPRRQPRNLRRLPVTVLIALPIGYWLLVDALHPGSGKRVQALAGMLIFFGALVAAALIRFFGPRLVPRQDGELDEREQAIGWRAGNISGSIVGKLATLGCFYAGFALVFDTWLPRSVHEWVFLGFAIQACALVLPVLVASWLLPSPEPEE